MSPVKKLRIYDYKDYRLFLKDYYKYKREQTSSFSARNFSKAAGFGSHSYLRMVMEGKRNLSLKALKKVAKAAGLDKEEASFFVALALYNQASLEKDKDYYFAKLIELKPQKKFHKLEKDRLAYFTNKNVVIIRELVALPHFKEDPEWISECLGSQVEPQDVEKCINILLRLKVLKRNQEGRLVLANGTVESPIDAESLEVFNFHRSIMSSAKDLMVTVPYDDREIISVTIPMSKKVLTNIKDIMRKCRNEVIKCINTNKDLGFDDVYQVNLQMVPVTRTRKEEV